MAPVGVLGGDAADLRLERLDVHLHVLQAFGRHVIRRAAGNLDRYRDAGAPGPAEQFADRNAAYLADQVVQREVDARLGARVLAVVDQVHQAGDVERLLADKLRSEVVVDRHLDGLHGLAEETDIGRGLPDPADSLVGLDMDQHVLQDRRRPFRRHTTEASAPLALRPRPVGVVEEAAQGNTDRGCINAGDFHSVCIPFYIPAEACTMSKENPVLRCLSFRLQAAVSSLGSRTTRGRFP